MIKKILLLAVSLSMMVLSYCQTPCVDGMAGDYPCDNVDLLSTITLTELGGIVNMNDIWGWTDPASDREFAIVGLRNGTSFVEVTDPINPVIIGFLETSTGNSLWRDIKVYENHAFIVSEAGGHGMQIFDLERLLETFEELPVTFDADAFYDNFGNAHNIVINEETGFAYGVGTGSFGGGLHFVDITNPLLPTFAGGFGGDGYTHDAQVIVYDGPDEDYVGKELAFCCNEDAVTIVDVTDKTDPQQISTLGYDFSAYTHQGWLTDDLKYFIFNDEIDETSGFTENTKTFFMDISDLDNPEIHSQFFSTSTAIDHNLYNKGSLCYQSNYRSGLRILDIGDIPEEDINEVGYFDSQPDDDIQEYSGTWSNYVYFPSGTVIMSDMYSNFFILKPTLINAYRYTEVCGSVDGVEFYIDVTKETDITEVINTKDLPDNMNIEFSEIVSPGQIFINIEFTADIAPGDYIIPVELNNEGVSVFEEDLKIVVIEGDVPEFTGLTPEDEFEETSNIVNLEWDAIDGLDSYRLVISQSEDFSDPVVDTDVSDTSYEFEGLGWYYWKLIAPSSCRIDYESDVHSFNINFVGVEELDSTFGVYPNPVQNELIINGVTGTVEIISLDGKLVDAVKVNGLHVLDVSGYATGFYVIQETGSSLHQRFFKEK